MITYDELVMRRKMCRLCMQTDPDKIHNGDEFDFDPPVTSYWSQWLGHQQPRILIVGQDFGNVEYFCRHRGIDKLGNETNDNLLKLLFEADIEVGNAPDCDPVAPVFLTNSILCLKSGPMNGPIKERWVNACSQNHLLSLTNYLNPPIVVGMGTMGWRAVRRVFQLASTPQGIKLAAGGSWDTPTGTRIFAVVHCSRLGILNRPWPQQVADWQKIGTTLRELPPSANF
jgi:uracil-DNA glycosylase